MVKNESQVIDRMKKQEGRSQNLKKCLHSRDEQTGSHINQRKTVSQGEWKLAPKRLNMRKADKPADW